MKSYEYYISKLKKKFDKNDKFIFMTVFISAVINYLYLLTHHCLSHDGLFNGPIYKSGEWELALGRPLLIIVDKLRGGLVASSIIFVIGMICVCLTLMIVRRIFSIDKKSLLFLLSILLVSFPTIADGSLYIYCFDSYCFSMLFSAIGAYLIIRKKYFFSIFFVAASLALYQAFISLCVSLILIYFIIQLLDGNNYIVEFVKGILVVLIGMIVYFVGLKFGLLILNRTLADYKGADSIGFGIILNLPANIVECYKDFYNYLFGNEILFNSYFKRNIYNFIILSIMVFVIFFKLFKLKKSNCILILLGLLLLPVFICVINLIATDTNIIILTAIGFYSLYVLALLVIDKYCCLNVFRNIGISVFGLLIFTLFLSDNAEFMAREDVYNNFYYNTSIALNKAVMLDDYDDNMKWMFNSIYYYSSPLNEMSLGFVSTQQGSYDNFRGLEGIRIFYSRYLGKNMDFVSYEEYKKILDTDDYRLMDIGSVKVIDNVIVVKTSEKEY